MGCDKHVADRRSDSMKMSATTVRRGLYGMFAGGLLAFGSAAIVMPGAGAEPNTTTNCTQSGIATTASTGSAGTATPMSGRPPTHHEIAGIFREPTLPSLWRP